MSGFLKYLETAACIVVLLLSQETTSYMRFNFVLQGGGNKFLAERIAEVWALGAIR